MCENQADQSNGDHEDANCAGAQHRSCFTALLAQMSLDDVLKKLKSVGVSTVELGTGNYPGDAHCKLSMLENRAQLDEFRKIMAEQGFTISALS